MKTDQQLQEESNPIEAAVQMLMHMNENVVNPKIIWDREDKVWIFTFQYLPMYLNGMLKCETAEELAANILIMSYKKPKINIL